jgi:hypothetical protein
MVIVSFNLFYGNAQSSSVTLPSATPSHPSLELGSLSSCAHRILSIKQLDGCRKVTLDSVDTKLAQDALDDLNVVLQSDLFKQAVLNEHFDSPQMIRSCQGQECNVVLTNR